MNKKSKILIITFMCISIIILSRTNVNAEAFSSWFCIDDINYNVEYENSIKPEDIIESIKKLGNNIEKDVIYELKIPNHEDATAKFKKTAYSCKPTSNNQSCYFSSKSSEFMNKYAVSKEMIEKQITAKADGGKTYIELNLGKMNTDPPKVRYTGYYNDSGTWIKVADPNTATNNFDTLTAKSELTKHTKSDGSIYYTITINSLDVSSIDIEYYFSSGECKEALIGRIIYPINTMFPNPAKIKEKKYKINTVCTEAYNNASSRQKVNSLMTLCNEDTVNRYDYNQLIDNTSSLVSHYEYLKNFLLMDEWEEAEETTGNMSNEKKCYASMNNEKNSICNSTKEPKSYAGPSGKSGEFSYTCTDTISFKGFEPQLTFPGGGVTYNMTYKLERVCKTSGIETASPLPKCSYFCRAEHQNPIYNNPEEPQKGGPNEEFDNCVKLCDGGKYTQECINICYSDVYGENTNRSAFIKKMNNLLTNKQDYENKRMILDNNSKNYEVIKLGPPYHKHEADDGGHCSCDFSAWCEAHETKCYSDYSPKPCSDDPCLDYDNDVKQIAGYVNTINSEASGAANINEGTLTLKIKDSYLINNGESFTFESKNKDSDIKVELTTNNSPVTQINGRQITIGTGGSGCKGPVYATLYDYTSTVEVKAISLPQAWVNKIYGNVIYQDNHSQGGNHRYYQVSKKRGETLYNFYPYTLNENDNVKKDFYDGDHKYYTSFYSKSINVRKDSNGKYKAELLSTNEDPCYNIKVEVKGLGNSRKSYSFNNYCYYGLYNGGSIKKCNNPPCPEDRGLGETYIFRPIELSNDIFPNREPRWNWTDAASLNKTTYGSNQNLAFNDPYLKYHVEPSKTIEHIASKGENIYNPSENEIDYEIEITTSNIATIKRYNKNKSYLDFDLDCNETINQATFCKSKFLRFNNNINNPLSFMINAQVGTNNDGGGINE